MAGKNKKDKVKKNGSDCEDWRWGPCVPNSKDCGVGYREGTCNEETKKLKCKIPCNWKKEFGGSLVRIAVPAASGSISTMPGVVAVVVVVGFTASPRRSACSQTRSADKVNKAAAEESLPLNRFPTGHHKVLPVAAGGGHGETAGKADGSREARIHGPGGSGDIASSSSNRLPPRARPFLWLARWHS
uniref:Uncharacterized protein n=1 Tax=Sphaerodactylus townsendi TaxID=933632 RepID=A0ACB8G459_9SAUR